MILSTKMSIMRKQRVAEIKKIKASAIPSEPKFQQVDLLNLETRLKGVLEPKHGIMKGVKFEKVDAEGNVYYRYLFGEEGGLKKIHITRLGYTEKDGVYYP